MQKIFVELFLACGTPANADDFLVNSLADDSGESCDGLPDDLSLREAIQAADGSPGPDSILFDPLPGAAPVAHQRGLAMAKSDRWRDAAVWLVALH